MIENKINFPKPTGVKCNMMPFVQGDDSSLPEEYAAYGEIIQNNFLEKGEIGFLTLDESYVEAGKSQRGFNSAGIERNVHIEVGKGFDVYNWGNSWSGKCNVEVDRTTMILIANSISDTCRVWNNIEERYTPDGDLSNYIHDYPEDSGILLKAGELAKLNILSPHECINQKQSGYRQFIRIVGKGVRGREEYFTINPLLN